MTTKIQTTLRLALEAKRVMDLIDDEHGPVRAEVAAGGQARTARRSADKRKPQTADRRPVMTSPATGWSSSRRDIEPPTRPP